MPLMGDQMAQCAQHITAPPIEEIPAAEQN
jgi:hypothetical protein